MGGFPKSTGKLQFIILRLIIAIRPIFVCLAVLFFATAAGRAQDLRTCHLFADNMVFQREAKVPVWGWSKPDAAVEVSFAGQVKRGKADDNGAWRVMLDPLPASAESREMLIKSGAECLVIRNVLVGEVWLASGQSNMEWPIRKAVPLKHVFPDLDKSRVRVMTVKTRYPPLL